MFQVNIVEACMKRSCSPTVPPKISPANILDERNPNEEQYLSEVGSATGSDDDGGNRPASVFLQELYPGLAAEKITGSLPGST